VSEWSSGSVSEWSQCMNQSRFWAAALHCLILLAEHEFRPRRTFLCRPKVLIPILGEARTNGLESFFLSFSSKPLCMRWTTSRGHELCGSLHVFGSHRMSNTSPPPPMHFHFEIRKRTAVVMSTCNPISKATGYGLDGSRQGQSVSFSPPSALTETPPASYPMDIRSSFPGDKTGETWSSTLTSIQCLGY